MGQRAKPCRAGPPRSPSDPEPAEAHGSVQPARLGPPRTSPAGAGRARARARLSRRPRRRARGPGAELAGMWAGTGWGLALAQTLTLPALPHCLGSVGMGFGRVTIIYHFLPQKEMVRSSPKFDRIFILPAFMKLIQYSNNNDSYDFYVICTKLCARC